MAADPGNQKHRRNLAVTRHQYRAGPVLSGDIKGGLASNQKALAICAALLAENPSNADFRRLLAISYQNDGDYRASSMTRAARWRASARSSRSTSSRSPTTP